MKIPRGFPIQFAATVLLMGLGSLAAPCLAEDANTGNAISFAKTKQLLGLEGLKHYVTGTLAAENGSLVFTTLVASRLPNLDRYAIGCRRDREKPTRLASA